jgi:hypothetical protein
MSSLSSAPVDDVVLIQLVAQVGDDPDGTFRDDLIDSYLGEASDQVTRLAVACRTGDAEETRAIAHSLRSASALLGALPLAGLLADAERVAVSTPTDLSSLAVPVETEFARVARALARLTSAGNRRPGTAPGADR